MEVSVVKEISPEGVGCWIICGLGCAAVCSVCISDGPVPIADAVGSTAGFKTGLAAASFV